MRTAIYTLAVLVFFLATAGTAASHSTGVAHKHKKPAKAAPKSILIKRDMVIENCEERGVDEYVFFIYSRYCPHCKKAMLIVEELARKNKLGSSYLPVDTSTKEGRDLLNQFGIRVQYVPTLIVDCKAHVGAKKDEYYEEVLTGKKK